MSGHQSHMWWTDRIGYNVSYSQRQRNASVNSAREHLFAGRDWCQWKKCKLIWDGRPWGRWRSRVWEGRMSSHSAFCNGHFASLVEGINATCGWWGDSQDNRVISNDSELLQSCCTVLIWEDGEHSVALLTWQLDDGQALGYQEVSCLPQDTQPLTSSSALVLIVWSKFCFWSVTFPGILSVWNPAMAN